MLRLSPKLTTASLILGALALDARPAAACGGFFCSQAQPVNQAAERIIFAQNPDASITAVIQILYEGPSENFSWLLPINGVPESDQLAVASDVAFQRLQFATNPQFNLTTTVEGTCRDNFGPQGVSAAGDSAATPVRETCEDNALLAGCDVVNVAASGVVGAFEWTVLSVNPNVEDPVAPTLEWLTQNGYDVTPQGTALMGPYLADGMNLLALRLTKGSDTGSIRPIQITYPAAAPMIPIKLTAVAANEDMGVMAWVLSSARAVPFNYNALELNEARINWFNAALNYEQVVNEAADDAGGNGFVTEFAGPTSQLASVVWQDFEEQTWQQVKGGTYFDFESLFQTVYSNYVNLDGFWDALRRTVTLPDDISFDDFKLCPTCYSDDLEFSPTALMAAIESDVIEPMRGVQRLIDQAPYATRLYSTLSASEMTIDPVFVFNPDLPEVSNVHQATRIIECDRGVYQNDAPWRIEFPQGSVIRGTPQTFGAWPDAVADQPANFQVLMLADSGDGQVVANNEEAINTALASYNETMPRRDASDQPAPYVLDQSSGGLCSLPAAPGASRSAPLSLGLGLLAAASWARRRRRA
jgi:RNAse (barnase) inhibitor barstar